MFSTTGCPDSGKRRGAIDLGFLLSVHLTPSSCTYLCLVLSRARADHSLMQRTLRRYFDPSIPSAEVKPTQISKVSHAPNSTNVTESLPPDQYRSSTPPHGPHNRLPAPYYPGDDTPILLAVSPLARDVTRAHLRGRWTVAGTTVWSGLSYINRSGVKILTGTGKNP